ncbi:hypothetical protein IscW_ISCW018092 [Ixodes scapularis]|uniref:Uncharacterized protein n=1 Tax=Ixodes scapularis TaxID=6945 RepID=B7PEG6_IXOSC|nr:hypothetical protein IscW_ISCW018092 [Ixodes scapularis]|eukprot:XP_002433588.1 hypothetical protein IscW_ISCW018092 [Ixodes scapularis]
MFPEYGRVKLCCLFLVTMVPCTLLVCVVIPSSFYTGVFLWNTYSQLDTIESGDKCYYFYEYVCYNFNRIKMVPFRHTMTAWTMREDHMKNTLKKALLNDDSMSAIKQNVDALLKSVFGPDFPASFGGSVEGAAGIIGANNLTARYLALRLLLSLTPALTDSTGQPAPLNELYNKYHKDYLAAPPRFMACIDVLEHAMPHVLSVFFMDLIQRQQKGDKHRPAHFELRGVLRSLIRQNLTTTADRVYSFSSHTNAKSRVLSYRKVR